MADAGGIEPRRNGLRVDPAKQLAWQRRGAERYAAKARGRRNAARLTSRIDRRPKPGNDWPTAVRRAAALRSGGACEIDGEDPATHLHHRQLRRHGDHRICNALHLCARHHDLVHHNRGGSSYANGWLVRATDDPATVPVVLHDTRQFLTFDGDYREAA